MSGPPWLELTDHVGFVAAAIGVANLVLVAAQVDGGSSGQRRYRPGRRWLWTSVVLGAFTWTATTDEILAKLR